MSYDSDLYHQQISEGNLIPNIDKAIANKYKRCSICIFCFLKGLAFWKREE
jgi:hypothetical protein